MLLIDTDVMIWYARGHAGAQARLDAIQPWQISVITYLELAQGCRDKGELRRLQLGLIHKAATQIWPLTPTISDRAVALIDSYALSAGLRLADALIAATALDLGLTLLTGNAKHFGMIQELSLERFVP